MKKQDIIISDDALTKEQKEKLEQEFFERQQKELEDFQRKQEEYQKAMDNAR